MTWGRHKARTKPSPGNHDYNTSGATGYFSYFGSLAGPSGVGYYYSYDVGTWHVVSRNSEVAHGVDSAQEQWLRADLAASTDRIYPYSRTSTYRDRRVEPAPHLKVDQGSLCYLNRFDPYQNPLINLLVAVSKRTA